MTTNLAKPRVGMVIRGKRNGAMYRIAIVEGREVYIQPYWGGAGESLYLENHQSALD